MRNTHGHVVKMPFGAGTKRYVAKLASALVYNFYPLRTSIIWSNEAQLFKPVSYGIFYFNKVCSCKILMCVRREVLPPWPRNSLP